METKLVKFISLQFIFYLSFAACKNPITNILDVVPPSVTIVSPITGSTVSDTVTITAIATDAAGISNVTLWVNGIQVAGSDDTSEPYEFLWDTNSSANGSNNTITVRAFDTNDNATDSNPIVVTVDNRKSALRFDGNDDYVGINHHPDLNFGAADFTVSLWVYFNDLQDDSNGLIHKDNFSGITNPYNGWHINIGEGNLRFFTRTINSTFSHQAKASYMKTNLNLSQWYHIAGVRRANTLYLYVDGVLQGQATEPVPIDVSTNIDMRIGSLSPTSPQNFDGIIDEVRIWRVARTQTEIEADMNRKLKDIPINLVVYYPLDDGNGQVTTDLAQGNHGRLGISNSVDSHDPEWIEVVFPH